MEEIDELTYREIPIAGYEGLYVMNGFGVKSLARWVDTERYGKPYKAFRKERILKMAPNGGGYPTVCLYQGGVQKQILFHRLKAALYIPNPENKPCVNHKNGIKTDFSLSNLEWCTVQENTIHSYCTGLQIAVNGSAHYKSKEVSQYTLDGVLVATYSSQGEARRITGISQGNISNVLLGKAKFASGFLWKFT
jgi:hypothetical protein